MWRLELWWNISKLEEFISKINTANNKQLRELKESILSTFKTWEIDEELKNKWIDYLQFRTDITSLLALINSKLNKEDIKNTTSTITEKIEKLLSILNKWNQK